MIYACIWLYTGLLFAEVSHFSGKYGWVYPACILAWPVLVPIIILMYRRGAITNGSIHRQP